MPPEASSLVRVPPSTTSVLCSFRKHLLTVRPCEALSLMLQERKAVSGRWLGTTAPNAGSQLSLQVLPLRRVEWPQALEEGQVFSGRGESPADSKDGKEESRLGLQAGWYGHHTGPMWVSGWPGVETWGMEPYTLHSCGRSYPTGRVYKIF